MIAPGNIYTTKLYQYLFFVGFTIGMRPPSELCNLDVTDIVIDGKRRHWCAAARMIEWNYNLDRVSSWLGHSHLEMTKRYVHMAEEYYKQDQGSWLRHAIRSPSKTMLRCKHADTQENRYIGKKASIDDFSPVSKSGLGGI